MNRTISIPLAVAGLLVAATLGQAQATDDAVGVHDGAKLFSTDAAKAAEQGLREVQSGSEGHWQVLVTTVESLHGKAPRELAVEAAEKTRLKGLSVVISKADKKVFVEPSRSAESAFPKSERERVVTSFTNAFKKGDFDRGLRDAVAEVRFASLGVGVRDGAAMFSPDAVAKADRALDALRRKTKWSAAIETVPSLNGRPRREAVEANARAVKVHGLYVLISKGDKTVDAVPSRAGESAFSRDRIKAVDAAISSAFKAGDFDKGLLDAVEPIRLAAESDTSSIARSFTPSGAVPTVAEDVKPPVPHPTTPAPGPLPVPAANEAGSALPVLFMVGGVVLLLLWLVSKLFRGSRAPVQQQQPGSGYPGGQPGAPPGPRPGYGPQAGFGPQAPPAPGYGYGPPPQQGGGGGGMGGLVTGALGGLGGAIAGNMIYDQMTHHQGGQGPAHVPGGVVPPAGSNSPASNPGANAPAPESYDPNAGAGGSWGTPDEPAANTEADPGAGGSWGPPDEAADTGGSWAAPEEPSADTDEPSADTGGDWGSEPADTGGDSGGGDDQGGSW